MQSDRVKLWTKTDSWVVAAVLIGVIITLANAA